MKILSDVDLSQFTSFSIGGKAKYLIYIEKEEDLKEFFKFAKEKKMEYFVLGKGTNTIFDDKGYNGIIIRPVFKYINFLNPFTIEVSAGVNLSKFILYCLEKSLKGYEKMLGIPGTIGGAVRGNAGSKGQEIKDHLLSVKFYQNGKLKTYNKEECEFCYRESKFKHLKNIIIISAIFQLKRGNKHVLFRTAKRIIKERKQKFSIPYPNSGCFFKNPIIYKQKLPSNISKKAVQNYDDKKIKISGGWLIENVGLKGFKQNNVGVSDIHSLFFINYGKANFSDLITLMNIIQEKVYKKFSIRLEPEVELVYNDS